MGRGEQRGTGGGVRAWRLLLLTLAAMLLVPAVASARLMPGQSASFKVTYYWFSPETWFAGKPIAAPGLAGTYREDFLYSARGVPMEGTGTDLAGDAIHYAGGSGGYWVNQSGARTDPGSPTWTHGPPYWRDGGWRNAQGAPTFQHLDGSWENGQGVKLRPYHDTFGTGAGTPVTPWHTIATDVSVIPRNTNVYVAALASSPAHGCFAAQDTGGAITGRHIDVLVPPTVDLATLPETSVVTALAPNQTCAPTSGTGGTIPPAPPTAPSAVKIRYTMPAREGRFRARRVPVAGLRGWRAREDFLYSAHGVTARGIGFLPGSRRLVARGGGFWVNSRGRRTDPTASGGWTHGAPYWRDGGWRNARGWPTFRRLDGSWSRGAGVRKLRYRDRFRLAKPGERTAWHSVGIPAGIAALGSYVRLAAFPNAGCFVADYAPLQSYPDSVEVVVPAGTDLSSLPSRSPFQALPAAGAGACAI